MEEVENHHLLITEERNLYKKYISLYLENDKRGDGFTDH